jgi:hypothetical protein
MGSAKYSGSDVFGLADVFEIPQSCYIYHIYSCFLYYVLLHVYTRIWLAYSFTSYRHLRYSLFLAVVSKAGMNIYVRSSYRHTLFTPFGWIRKRGTVGYLVSTCVAMYEPATAGWVTRAYNPSYSGGRDQEDHSLRPAQANSLKDPVSKILNTKTGWWSGSSGRVPA